MKTALPSSFPKKPSISFGRNALAGWSPVCSSYADAANALEVPGWTRLDIGARYFMDVQGKLLTLRARIDNLTDRAYWASAGGYPGAGYLVVGAPRTVTLSASLDF